MPYGLAPDMSFDDYLAATFEADPSIESPVNPMSLKDRGVNSAKAAAKLAVAAKHQRIAEAAIAAKDEEAARIAKAAAVRAAAGGLRALARKDKDEGEEAGNLDDGAVRREHVRRHVGKGSVRESRPKGLPPRTTPILAADEGERCTGGDVAQVVASAEFPPPPEAAAGRAASAATAEEEEGEEKGDEGSRNCDLAELDLTALAARVAAEAERAKCDNEREDDDADFGIGDGHDYDNGEAEGTSLESGTVDDENGNLEDGLRTGGGKRAVVLPVGSSSSSPAATTTAATADSSKGGKTTSGSGGGGAAAGSSSSGEGRQTKSSKSWRSWAFGKKGPESGCGSSGGGGADTARTGGGGPAMGAVAKKSRKFTGRCWMAESFPLSLKQLLPLLEVVGTANKAFSKVARFMQKYGDLDMFPVKVQVPLILTVFMLLSFKQFRLLGNGPDCMAAPPDEFFQIPPGYTEDNLERAQSRSVNQGSATEQAGIAAADVAANGQVVETAAVNPPSLGSNTGGRAVDVGGSIGSDSSG
ncbi:hypothetical protein Vretimale_12287 [Volvox reticuliferus]|nr:hypothetical protein Vretifemale_8895 [Volvox reticuliferus]GIM08188.1 hypothetical protein Vretimale_12287 [Volvox reticuliferus]